MSRPARNVAARLAALGQYSPQAVRIVRKSASRYPKPVPEKYQRRARMRRLIQQWKRCEITFDDLDVALCEVVADHEEWLALRAKGVA